MSDPVMDAKLNVNTNLLNIIFDFLSHLSAGPNLFDCTETLVLYINNYLFTARCVFYVTLSLTPGGQN
jgi:hypothetical protein